MEPKYTLSLQDGIARIELVGRLDATNAPALQEELKKLIGADVKRMVFFAKDLEYISSAGLRVIIFAKQKVGVHADVYLIGASEAVMSVIRMSGLETLMFIQDTYTD